MKLTEAQRHAITHPGSVCVIASAGTGKTTVLIERIRHLIEQNLPLSNLLAFTFTEKAGREMLDRLLRKKILHLENLSHACVSTLHAFCQSLILQNANLLGLNCSSMRMLSSDAQSIHLEEKITKILRECLPHAESPITRFLNNYGLQITKRALHDLYAMDLINISKEKCRVEGADEGVKTQLILELIFEIKERQEKDLLERLQTGTLFFDDLEHLTLRLLQNHSEVRNKLHQRFQHILVDEFQDISPRQLQIIELLWQPKQNQILIVGDPKQAIYAFRNADVRQFFIMQNNIEKHGGITIELSDTFRTPSQVQNYFNQVFPYLLEKPGHKLYKKINSQKISDNEVLAKQILSSEEGDPAEKVIVETVQKLIFSGAQESDIAIISPTRSPFSKIIEKLNSAGIKTQTKAHGNIFDEPIILSLYYLLCYLAGARDLISQIGILRNTLFNFSEGFIDHLVKSGGTDLFSHQTFELFSAHQDSKEWRQLMQHFNRWQKLVEYLTPTQLFSQLKSDLKISNTPSIDAHLTTFKEVLSSWENEGKTRIQNCLHLLQKCFLSGIRISGESPSQNGVHLLTIHAAKGLEFDYVFVLSSRSRQNAKDIFIYDETEGFSFLASDGDEAKTLRVDLKETSLYKKLAQKADESLNEEKKRLLYVALTRTQKGLFLFPTSPSQKFLGELEKNPNPPLMSYENSLYWLSTKIEKNVGDLEFPINKAKDDSLMSEGKNLSEAETSSDFLSSQRTSSLPNTLSVTDLEAFHFCPKCFQLQKLQGLRPFTSTRMPIELQAHSRIPATLRGTFFHEVLQFFDFKSQNNLETVIDQALFNQHILDQENLLRTETHLFMRRMKENPILYSVLFSSEEAHAELEFRLPLGDLILTGQIDRLVKLQNPDTKKMDWLVIDYKTQPRLSEPELDLLAESYSFQMRCYALAVKKLFAQSHVNTLILFTAGPDLRILRNDTESLDKLERELKEIFNSLQKAVVKNHFPLTHDTKNCRHCPYFKDNWCGIKTEKSDVSDQEYL